MKHTLAAAAMWLLCSCAPVPMPPLVPPLSSAPALGDSIVVIGDTQRTMHGELLACTIGDCTIGDR